MGGYQLHGPLLGLPQQPGHLFVNDPLGLLGVGPGAGVFDPQVVGAVAREADWPELWVTISTRGGTGSGYASMFNCPNAMRPPMITAANSPTIRNRRLTAKATRRSIRSGLCERKIVAD